MSQKNEDTERVQFHKDICAEMTSLYEKKNHDYGSSFKCTRDRVPNAILVRLYDKVNRLCSLYEDPENIRVHGENIEDTLIDLANYAVMELVEIRVDKNKMTQACCDSDEDRTRMIAEVERALGIQLSTWQVDFILGYSDYVNPARQTGRTTAHILKALLSADNSPLNLYDRGVVYSICGDDGDTEARRRQFVHTLKSVYNQLIHSNAHSYVRPVLFQDPKTLG